MAENQKRTDDQDVQAFNQAQMSALDAAYEANPHLVDLKQAKELGVISEPLHDAIMHEIGEEEYTKAFTGAFMRENTRLAANSEGMTPEEMSRAAYKNAFFAITRKFQLEIRDKDLERPEGATMRALSKILRIRLHDGNIEGRNELQAMLARMGKKNSHRRVDVTTLAAEVKAQRSELSAKKADIGKAEKQKGELEKVDLDFSRLGAGVAGLVDKEGRKKAIEAYRVRVSDITAALAGYASLDSFKKVNFKRIPGMLDKFETDTIDVSPDRTASDNWRDYVEHTFAEFVRDCKKNLSRGDVARDEILKMHEDLKDGLHLFEYAKTGAWNPPQEKPKGLKARVKNLRKKKAPAEKPPAGWVDVDTAITDSADDLVKKMEIDLDSSTYGASLSAADTAVKDYKSDYDAFKRAGDFSPAKVKEFYDDKFLPMLQVVSPATATRLTALSGELDGLRSEEDLLDRTISSRSALVDRNVLEAHVVNLLENNQGEVGSRWRSIRSTSDEPARFKEYDALIAQLQSAARHIKGLDISAEHNQAVDDFLADIDKAFDPARGAPTQLSYDEASAEIAKFFTDLNGARSKSSDAIASSLKVDDGRATLEAAFPGLKVSGSGADITVEVRGVKSNFDHAAKNAGKALEFFESPDKLPALEESSKALASSVAAAKMAAAGEKAITKANGSPLVKPDASIPDKIRALDDHASVNKKMAQKTGRDAPTPAERQAYMEKATDAGNIVAAYKDLVADAKKFHAELGALVKQLAFAEKIGVQVEAGVNKLQISGAGGVAEKFEAFSLKSFSLDGAEKLSTLFVGEIAKDFLQDAPLAKFTAELDKAKGELSSCAGLTDDEAAKRVIAAMVAEQNPGMSLEKQQELATLILAGDVATLQAKESYGELAQKAGAEVLQAASIGNARALIDFQYKAGGKLVKPFMGLKPEDFQNVDKVMRLFDVGILNSKTGFILLAAFESFEGGKNSGLYNEAAERLKMLIAKDLGVEKRLHVSGIRRVVEDAFEDQLNATRPFVTEVFSWHSMHVGEWDMARVNALNNDFKALQEEAAREDVKNEGVLHSKLQKLLKEAKDNGVEGQVDFSADSLTAGYRNSKHFRSLEGFGHDLGDLSKRKAKALGIGFGKGTGAELGWRSASLFHRGASTALALGRLAIGTPLRMLAWPFRSGIQPMKYAKDRLKEAKAGDSPFSRQSEVRAKLKNVFGTFGKHVAGDWGKEKWKKTTYADRSDVTPAELRKMAEDYRKDAEVKPFEINEEPFVSMDPYKERIKKVDEMLKAKAA